ncbi:hypothetical protein JZ751_022911 [Albula glossodonta]|uniref:Uncharacterized protein n=1 Tax=Albula glossodonta TaxID=121402 RepID=A0A8T2PHK0_9TELE|nr:hypothetical protein JZ751_022911 [Albula glossodonta]
MSKALVLQIFQNPKEHHVRIQKFTNISCDPSACIYPAPILALFAHIKSACRIFFSVNRIQFACWFYILDFFANTTPLLSAKLSRFLHGFVSTIGFLIEKVAHLYDLTIGVCGKRAHTSVE